jgi:hypothetical protein
MPIKEEWTLSPMRWPKQFIPLGRAFDDIAEKECNGNASDTLRKLIKEAAQKRGLKIEEA